MKIVFASFRTASNKRKICQQKIDFDINASSNKLQWLIFRRTLITLRICCLRFSFNIFQQFLFCVARYCDYSTWVVARVASLSCPSLFSLLSPPHCPLLSIGFWLYRGKTDLSQYLVDARQNCYQEVPSNILLFVTHWWLQVLWKSQIQHFSQILELVKVPESLFLFGRFPILSISVPYVLNKWGACQSVM